MGEGTLVLLLLLAGGVLGGNDLVSVSAAIMLFFQLTGFGDVFGFLEQHGVDIGIIFLMLGLLLPFATEKLGLTATLRGLVSPAGIIAFIVGTVTAYLAARGVSMLQSHPEVLVGLLVGSLAGVYLLGGIPAGPLVAAGMAAVIFHLVSR